MSAEDYKVPSIEVYDGPSIQHSSDMVWVTKDNESKSVESILPTLDESVTLYQSESLPNTTQNMELDQLPVVQIAIQTPDGKIRECIYDEDTDKWFYNQPVRNKSGTMKFKDGLPVLERVNL